MTEIAPPTEANIQRAVALLRRGEPVAFPTETVYGLGAPANAQATVVRIFELKGRPQTKPLIVHVSGIEQARLVVDQWPERADTLARAFWPGPLTIILPSTKKVASAVSAGGATVAVRAPANDVAQAFIAELGEGLAAPSANPSGSPPPTTAQQVADYFGETLSMVLDGGPTTVKQASTVIDLSDPKAARILRMGSISAEELAPHIELRS